MRIVILALFAVTACAQETPAFHASVSLVHVDAEAVSAGGRIISGLHRDDFRVFDEGAPQPVPERGFRCCPPAPAKAPQRTAARDPGDYEIGRASCRERV